MALPIALSSVNLGSAAKLAKVQLSSARHIPPQKDAFSSPVCASPLHSRPSCKSQPARHIPPQKDAFSSPVCASPLHSRPSCKAQPARLHEDSVQGLQRHIPPQKDAFNSPVCASSLQSRPAPAREAARVPVPVAACSPHRDDTEKPHRPEPQVAVPKHHVAAKPQLPHQPQQLLLHQLERELKVQQGLGPIFAAAPPPKKPEEKAMHAAPRLMAAAAEAAAKQEDAPGAFLPAGCFQGVRLPDTQSDTSEGSETKFLALEEGAYLMKNIEWLRQKKRDLERQVGNMEARVRTAEAQKEQYKALFEESQSDTFVQASGEGRDREIVGLHQQLAALLMLKDAFNSENLQLQERMQAMEQSQRHGQASCVICMKNLANVVCLPCKHLALCSFCSQQSYAERSQCPICRGSISERMQIFMP